MATLVREDAAAARSMMLHFSFFNTSFIWLHAETLISYGRKKKKKLSSALEKTSECFGSRAADQPDQLDRPGEEQSRDESHNLSSLV